MSEAREELLRPSLSGSETLVAPYSVQTTFLTGFFGGPLAAVAILLVNSYRLRRVPRDLPAIVAMLAAVLLGMWALSAASAGAPVAGWIESQLGSRGLRSTYQAAALVIVGIGYLMHRKEQRNCDMSELRRPNGWIAGLSCILLGGAAMVAFLLMVTP